MSIYIHFLILIIGFIVLWYSSDRSILYSEQTAKMFGVSSVFIGFVLLAISTGLPELMVAIQSLIAGKPMLSAGDIIGSNFVDISVALGLSGALFGPVLVKKIDYTKQLTMLFLSSILMAFVFITGQLNKPIGVILLLIYFGGTFWLWKTRRVKFEVEEEEIIIEEVKELTKSTVLIRLFVFLILVIISSKFCVDSALALARNLALPLGIIGSVIFAIGTSLPEISLNIQAVRKKKYSLAIGNSLGSVFEQGALILGILSLAMPEPLYLEHLYHVAPFMFFSYAVVAFGLIYHKKINKIEGYLLLASYILFIVYELWFIRELI